MIFDPTRELMAVDSLRPKALNFIDDITEELKIAYLEDSLAWVVGFSGGKDSTALAQFVFYMLTDLPKRSSHKKVFIIASDTLVEMPSNRRTNQKRSSAGKCVC